MPIFSNLKEQLCKNNKHKVRSFFRVALIVSLAFLILLTSGFASVEFAISNIGLAAINISLFVITFLLVLFSVRPKLIVKAIKDGPKSFLRSIPKSALLLFLTLFFCLISLLVNVTKSGNLNGTIRIFLLFSSCLLLVAFVSFYEFAWFFCISVSAICSLSLIVFFVALTVSSSGATSFYGTGSGHFIVSFGELGFLIRRGIWNSESGLLMRMSGLFWEPSIFAAIICISFIFLAIIKPRKWQFFLIPNVLCLLLTASTGGYVLALLCLLFFFSSTIRSARRQLIFVSVSIFCLVALAGLALGPFRYQLASLLPQIFGKLTDINSSSGDVRLLSFGTFFKVFLSSPSFGLGPNGSIKAYESVLAGQSDVSATSTFGFFFGCFGFPGIVLTIALFFLPLFGNKRFSFANRLLLFLFLVLLFNLENMRYVSSSLILAIYVFKESIIGPSSLSNVKSDSPTIAAMLIYDKSEKMNTVKNLSGSLVIKGLSMVVGMLTVPIYNSFFGTDEAYGVWAVFISILAWSLMLDFGFGSGLRSRLGEALEKGDSVLAKQLVSSTYVGTTITSASLFVIAQPLIWTLDFNSILNVRSDLLPDLSLRMTLVLLLLGMCMEFSLKNIVYILYARKKAAIGSGITLISHGAVLASFIAFRGFRTENIFIFASILYSLSINIPLLIATFVLFSLKNAKFMQPSFSSFSKAACKSVMSFGVLYFVIQIAFVLTAETNSFAISWVFGPESVSSYTKYTKFFSAIIGLMAAVVQQPIWSAISSAVSRKDFIAIKKAKRFTFCIAGALFAMCLFIGIFLQTILDIWLQSKSISVEFFPVIAVIAYSFSFLLADAYVIICNALKLLKVQAFSVALSAVLKILFVVIIKAWPSLSGPFSWSVFLLVDAICYAPNLLILPLAIRREEKRLRTKGNPS